MTDAQRDADICKYYPVTNQDQYRDSGQDPRVQLLSLLKKAKEIDINFMGGWEFIMTR